MIRLAMVLLLVAGCRSGDDSLRHDKSVAGSTTLPDLRIDPDEADLSSVGVMLVANDGRILVAQTQDGLIRVFGPDGTSLPTLGRPGEGPGEFSRLTRIGWIGDSIWALDPGLARITIFDPDTGLVRSFRSPGIGLQGPTEREDGLVLEIYVQAILPDGSLRAIVGVPRGIEPPTWAADVDSGSKHYVRLSQNGAILGRIALRERDRCQVSFPIGSRGVGAMVIPLCPTPLSNDWDGAVADFLVFADVPEDDPDQPTYRVSLFGYRGDTAFVRDYPYQPIPVTAAMRDSMLERERKALEGLPPSYHSARPSYDMPGTLPPIKRVLVGRDSTLWLEEEDNAPEHHWRVLDVRGELIGLVTVPAAVRLRVAQRDMVWGTETDENDLEAIVRLRVSLDPGK